jgi:hypothetical protein
MFVVGLLLLAYVAVAQTKSAGQAGGPKVVHQDELFIVGIEARTTAAKEMSAQGVIPQQWQKFMQEGVLQKIPNKADQNIYAVITDFADKQYGEYSVVIGRTRDRQVPGSRGSGSEDHSGRQVRHLSNRQRASTASRPRSVAENCGLRRQRRAGLHAYVQSGLRAV